MLIKCKCTHCSTPLEFESDIDGSMVACPSCGLETQLHAPPQQPQPSLSATQQTAFEKLPRPNDGRHFTPCPTCSTKISRSAIACPHCGHAMRNYSALSFKSITLGVACGVLLAAGVLFAIRETINMPQARKAAQTETCISNMRLIDNAVCSFALENNKQASAQVTEKDLKAYIHAVEFPKCPAGTYSYLLTTVGKIVKCPNAYQLEMHRLGSESTAQKSSRELLESLWQSQDDLRRARMLR